MAGVLGCILSIVTAYMMGTGFYLSNVGYLFPGGGRLEYNIEKICYGGYIHSLAGILVALALLAFVYYHSELISKALSGLGGVTSLVSALLTSLWVLPGSHVPTFYQQYFELISLFVISAVVTLLSLILAGLAGIIERGRDKIAIIGYVLAFLGGLIPLLLGMASDGFTVATHNDIQWPVLAHVIGLIGYIGLGMTFYRSMHLPEMTGNSEEQRALD